MSQQDKKTFVAHLLPFLSALSKPTKHDAKAEVLFTNLLNEARRESDEDKPNIQGLF